VYHLEFRQFPHNVCRFNVSSDELRGVVEPWVRGQFVEIEDFKWSPHQARLTILEGPELALDQLKMGRGWRAAERDCKDVTDQVLAAAAQAVEVSTRESLAGSGAQGGAVADPLALGVQIAALLGSDPIGLLEAWRAAATSSPGMAPSQSLALAERAVRPRGAGEA
jgi:hypothetical protein